MIETDGDRMHIRLPPYRWYDDNIAKRLDQEFRAGYGYQPGNLQPTSIGIIVNGLDYNKLQTSPSFLKKSYEGVDAGVTRSAENYIFDPFKGIESKVISSGYTLPGKERYDSTLRYQF